MRMTSVPAGVYEHYKGNHYLVLGVARHDPSDEPMVVYVRLYERDGIPMTCRPLSDFTANVELGDGSSVPRFRFIDQSTSAAFAERL